MGQPARAGGGAVSSRQFAYQQRHRAKGLCILCSRKAVNALHCQDHRAIRRARNAAAMRRRRAKARA